MHEQAYDAASRQGQKQNVRPYCLLRSAVLQT